MYEGTPDFPDKDRLWEIVERYKRHDPLYRADGDPHVHEMGAAISGKARPLVAASARIRRRTDQPRSVDLVSRPHRRQARRPVVDTWWQTETGGIMISPLPGITTLLPGSATHPIPGIAADIVNDSGRTRSAGRRRLRRDHAPVARHAARHLGRRRALRQDVLVEVSRHLPRRRRLPPRRRRQLLVHGPHRRRDERQRPSHLNRRSRERARRSSQSRRSGGLRQERRHHRPSDLRVRDVTRSANPDRRSWPTSCAITSPRSSESSRGRSTSRSRTELPKTRSGKIMRRLLRDIAEGRTLGDTTTLADSAVVHELQDPRPQRSREGRVGGASRRRRRMRPASPCRRGCRGRECADSRRPR